MICIISLSRYESVSFQPDFPIVAVNNLKAEYSFLNLNVYMKESLTGMHCSIYCIFQKISKYYIKIILTKVQIVWNSNLDFQVTKLFPYLIKHIINKAVYLIISASGKFRFIIDIILHGFDISKELIDITIFSQSFQCNEMVMHVMP